MIVLERFGEFAAADFDAGPSGRPPLIQDRVNTNDLAHRTLAHIGARPHGKTHTERFRQMPFQSGVVGL